MAQENGWSGFRKLLRNLRDVMAAPATAQARLDRVATLIAADMVAEVCSIYVRRAGDVLELFATKGLNPDSVHRTRLRVGEGLVGDIAAHARPLTLADAQAHPEFAFRPETGEEIYHSLMGVPILHGGRVMGVLVIQNRTRRHYQDEEVEALQTIAMVLAEIITGGELFDPAERLPADGLALLPLRLDGIAFHGGIGVGHAVLHQPEVIVRRVVANDAEAELVRLNEALEGMHGALDEMLAASRFGGLGEHVEILESYRMFAEDRGWLRRIREAVGTGLTAEAAVRKIGDDMHRRMAAISDPYLRERLHDLEDLSNRLLQHLTRDDPKAARRALPDDPVVIARNMGPAELLDYSSAGLRAVVLEEGSPTAHVAIIARAMDIPVVGRVTGVLGEIEPGEPIIVDGDNGQVFIRPGEDVRQAFQASVVSLQRRRAAFAALRDAPAVTKDGVAISLNLNAGLLVDTKALEETGADGIGLYRTEIPFMVRSDFPGVEDQARLYAQVLDRARNKPVVFRTLDVGGDKVLPYLRRDELGEENPAMGWRAIRIALDRPAMLRQQLRALLRAGAGRKLDIMFPMVAEIAELTAARRLLALEMRRERRRGGAMPARIRIGAMLEVPALIWQLPALLPRVDFLSVGSNDLLQFLFASDRGNPRLVDRYDALSPPVITMLRGIVGACDAGGVPLALCGEMASRPLEAMALIGLGFRSLSMPAPAVGPVKAMLRSLGAGALSIYMESLDARPEHSVREKLRAFAIDHGVSI